MDITKTPETGGDTLTIDEITERLKSQARTLAAQSNGANSISWKLAGDLLNEMNHHGLNSSSVKALRVSGNQFAKWFSPNPPSRVPTRAIRVLGEIFQAKVSDSRKPGEIVQLKETYRLLADVPKSNVQISKEISEEFGKPYSLIYSQVRTRQSSCQRVEPSIIEYFKRELLAQYTSYQLDSLISFAKFLSDTAGVQRTSTIYKSCQFFKELHPKLSVNSTAKTVARASGYTWLTIRSWLDHSLKNHEAENDAIFRYLVQAASQHVTPDGKINAPLYDPNENNYAGQVLTAPQLNQTFVVKSIAQISEDVNFLQIVFYPSGLEDAILEFKLKTEEQHARLLNAKVYDPDEHHHLGQAVMLPWLKEIAVINSVSQISEHTNLLNVRRFPSGLDDIIAENRPCNLQSILYSR